jgi:hypothetical protein
LRISTLEGLSRSIELAHSAWLSLYDDEMTNRSMLQMPSMHVQMILMDPNQVSLAIEGP